MKSESKKVNKKEHRLAIMSALYLKRQENKLKFFDDNWMPLPISTHRKSIKNNTIGFDISYNTIPEIINNNNDLGFFIPKKISL